METLKTTISTMILIMLGVLCLNAVADDAIDADDFVNDAAAKGIAEVETAKMALKKSQTQAVRDFAQRMVADHTKANQELKALAMKKNIEVPDDAELMNQAKAFILKQRDGESFDKAYANNQVMAHENTIELFQHATKMKDAQLKAFAQKTLPTLQEHLKMARQLQTTVGADGDWGDDDEMDDMDDMDHEDMDEMHHQSSSRATPAAPM